MWPCLLSIGDGHVQRNGSGYARTSNIEAIVLLRINSYSLNQETDQVAQGKQTIPFGAGQLRKDLTNPISIGSNILAPIDSDIKAIDVARKLVCGFNQTGGQFAIGKQCKISSLGVFSRKDRHTELSRRSKDKGIKSEVFVLEADLLMRIEVASGNNFLLRRQRLNRFDPFTKLSITAFSYILNRSIQGCDHFILFFLAFLLLHSFLSRKAWEAVIHWLFLKHCQATIKIPKHLEASPINDNMNQIQSIIFIYLSNSFDRTATLSLSSLGHLYAIYDAIARLCANASLNVKGRPTAKTSCLQQGKLRPLGSGFKHTVPCVF
jgi:hypothetical protein